MQREAGEEARMLSRRHRLRDSWGLARYLQHILQRYNLSPRAYLELRRRQQGACGVCARTFWWRSLEVDHRHSDGVVRGLLCHRCNRFLVPTLETSAIRRILQYAEDPVGVEELIPAADLTAAARYLGVA